MRNVPQNNKELSMPQPSLKTTILSISKRLTNAGFIVHNQPYPPNGVIIVGEDNGVPCIKFISRNVGEQYEAIDKCHKLLKNDYTLLVDFTYEENENGYSFSRFRLFVLTKGLTLNTTITIR